MPKYYYEKKIIDKFTPYEPLLNDRDLKYVNLYTKGIKIKIDYSKIPYRKHIWSKGDNLFRLANTYYSDKNMWWIIAFYNQKPTDAHFTIGEEMYIPVRPSDVISQVRDNGY
ncbi:MAG: hypothetical protein ACXACY_31295 [Candidatus Hodarchaeales archaeon]|jgi:hypothetical protein